MVLGGGLAAQATKCFAEIDRNPAINGVYELGWSHYKNGSASKPTIFRNMGTSAQPELIFRMWTTELLYEGIRGLAVNNPGYFGETFCQTTAHRWNQAMVSVALGKTSVLWIAGLAMYFYIFPNMKWLGSVIAAILV